jgi:hypothetical protein
MESLLRKHLDLISVRDCRREISDVVGVEVNQLTETKFTVEIEGLSDEQRNHLSEIIFSHGLGGIVTGSGTLVVSTPTLYWYTRRSE